LEGGAAATLLPLPLPPPSPPALRELMAVEGVEVVDEAGMSLGGGMEWVSRS
jgi:hypothetical protein